MMLLRLKCAAPGMCIFLDTTVCAMQLNLTVTSGSSITLTCAKVPHADVIIGMGSMNSTFSLSFFCFC